jgi:hypothetical protein
MFIFYYILKYNFMYLKVRVEARTWARGRGTAPSREGDTPRAGTSKRGGTPADRRRGLQTVVPNKGFFSFLGNLNKGKNYFCQLWLNHIFWDFSFNEVNN